MVFPVLVYAHVTRNLDLVSLTGLAVGLGNPAVLVWMFVSRAGVARRYGVPRYASPDHVTNRGSHPN